MSSQDASELVVAGSGDVYVAPFGTPLGQILLIALLSMYVATLVWMRRMATGSALPRFVGAIASPPRLIHSDFSAWARPGSGPARHAGT